MSAPHAREAMPAPAAPHRCEGADTVDVFSFGVDPTVAGLLADLDADAFCVEVLAAAGLERAGA